MNKITVEELKSKLDDIFLKFHGEDIVYEIIKIKDQYPYIRENEPWKDIYWDAVRKWHLEVYPSFQVTLRNENYKNNDTNMKKIQNWKSFSESLEEEHELEYNLKKKKEEDNKDKKKKKKKINEFFSFINEAAVNEVQKEVKKIISEMFAVAKNIKFSGEESVEFEIDEGDYKIGYSQPLKMEYSEGVMKKRTHQVSLKFDSKSKEGTDNKPIYKIKFNIVLKPVSDAEVKKPKKEDYDLAWEFEKKPKEVISFVKSQKQTCDWNDTDKLLYIKKSAYDKLPTAEFKSLVREEGGVKVQA